jgi:hypothetical protein
MSEDELKNQFSNYERTVWVVNSIHGHLLKYYKDILKCFDRFPKFPLGDGTFLTPDFAVSFEPDFNIVVDVKRSLGSREELLNATFKQVCKYAQPLKFRLVPEGLHEYPVKSHDIVLFTNLEYAAKEARKLRELIKRNSFPESPVIIFSDTFESQQAKPRWIFSCLTEFSDRFSDDSLPEDRRLSKRHQDDRDPIVIYASEFAAIQAQHPFCNDEPPAVYTAVLLWAKVFPNLIPQDKLVEWTLEQNNQGSLEFLTTVEAIIAELDRQRLGVRKQQVMDALSLLEAGKLASHTNTGFAIRYRRFRALFADEADDVAATEAAIDHTKNGLIREISRGMSKPSPKKPGGLRPKRVKTDSRQQMLDLD